MKFAGAVSVLLTGLMLAASNWAAGATADALLQQGETLYRSGTSTRQNPVIAVVSGGTRLPGSAASCAGCHGRDGSGRSELSAQAHPPEGDIAGGQRQGRAHNASKPGAEHTPLRAYWV